MLGGLEKCRALLDSRGINSEVINIIYTEYLLGAKDIYIVKETLRVICDGSLYLDKLDEKTVVAYCIMIYRYICSCGRKYKSRNRWKSAVNNSSAEVYRINAANGLRYATVSEVDNGARGLIPLKIYPAGEDICHKLNLLMWSFTGNVKYLDAIEDMDTFNVDKTISWTFGVMQKYASRIIGLIEWMEEGSNFSSACKEIKEYSDKGGFRYAEFAEDEIKENISKKQVIFTLRNMDIKNKILDCCKDENDITPYQMSILRDIYESIANRTSCKIEEKCEHLIKCKKQGYIDEKEFVFKIIYTLKSQGYVKCSEKQMAIIDDAIKSVNNYMEAINRVEECKGTEGSRKEEESGDIMQQMSLSNIYQSLVQ